MLDHNHLPSSLGDYSTARQENMSYLSLLPLAQCLSTRCQQNRSVTEGIKIKTPVFFALMYVG